MTIAMQFDTMPRVRNSRENRFASHNLIPAEQKTSRKVQRVVSKSWGQKPCTGQIGREVTERRSEDRTGTEDLGEGARW